MPVLIAFVIAVSWLAGIYKVEKPPKEELQIAAGISPGGVIIREQVKKPLSEFKNINIIKQAFDFSCGSAALAMLLNHYLGENFTEMQVINGLLRYGDLEKIKERRSFSLFDMKRFVTVLGYKGEGYKAEIEDLKTLGRPCIVPLTLFGYFHFAVFKGMYKDHVFLADLSMGNVSLTLPEFKDIWHKNVVFVVFPKGEKGMDAFMLTEDDLKIIDSDVEREIIMVKLSCRQQKRGPSWHCV